MTTIDTSLQRIRDEIKYRTDSISDDVLELINPRIITMKRIRNIRESTKDVISELPEIPKQGSLASASDADITTIKLLRILSKIMGSTDSSEAIIDILSDITEVDEDMHELDLIRSFINVAVDTQLDQVLSFVPSKQLNKPDDINLHVTSHDCWQLLCKKVNIYAKTRYTEAKSSGSRYREECSNYRQLLDRIYETSAIAVRYIKTFQSGKLRRALVEDTSPHKVIDTLIHTIAWVGTVIPVMYYHCAFTGVPTRVMYEHKLIPYIKDKRPIVGITGNLSSNPPSKEVSAIIKQFYQNEQFFKGPSEDAKARCCTIPSIKDYYKKLTNMVKAISGKQVVENKNIFSDKEGYVFDDFIIECLQGVVAAMTHGCDLIHDDIPAIATESAIFNIEQMMLRFIE